MTTRKGSATEMAGGCVMTGEPSVIHIGLLLVVLGVPVIIAERRRLFLFCPLSSQVGWRQMEQGAVLSHVITAACSAQQVHLLSEHQQENKEEGVHRRAK